MAIPVGGWGGAWIQMTGPFNLFACHVIFHDFVVIFFMILLLSADFFIYFFEQFFQEHYISVKR